MLSTTVLVVGSGPVGLWLAYELRSANLDVLVIDSITGRKKRRKYSKALSVSAGSLETFASRGVVNLFIELGIPMPKMHFGALPTLLDLNSGLLGSQYPHNLMIPQVRTEEILLDLCDKVGVRFAWGCQFLSLVQDEKAVLVTVRSITNDPLSGHTDLEIKAVWVVGCDGTHSKARESAGITFEGTPSTMSGVLADIQLGTKPPAGLLVGKGPKAGSLLAPMGDGVHHRFVAPLRPVLSTTSSETPTMDEIKSALQETFGSDYGAHSPLWISRFGNACRVASSFKADRVFLAGDAGHQIYPAGGQGMNLGFQDATSLAWRLAMVEKGIPPAKDVAERILDSYSIERRAAAQAVILNVQAQIALLTAASPAEIALRSIFSEALSNSDINAMWSRRVTGFGDPTEAYINMSLEMKDGVGASSNNKLQEDLLVGTRITGQICGSTIGELFRATISDKFVLLEQNKGLKEGTKGEDSDLQVIFQRWMDRITVLPTTATSGEGDLENIKAILVRPDMRIAWVARVETPTVQIQSSLTMVLTHWFGTRD